jgi:hypothetical protein
LKELVAIGIWYIWWEMAICHWQAFLCSWLGAALSIQSMEQGEE